MNATRNDEAPRNASPQRFALPRRSARDRKLAGVAGGLGRALGIDPVLLRVAFVVLAIFGGSGVLLYCLGWLLMAADGDEVSAIEALAGRGRSSVSTALTVVLIVVGLSSAGSVFSWGLPFWPVVIAALVVFVVVRHGRGGSCGRQGGGPAGGGPAGPAGQQPRDWGRWADDVAERVSAWGARAGQRAGEVADDWSRRWSAAPSGSGEDGGPKEAVHDRSQSGPDVAPQAGFDADPRGHEPPSPEELLARGRRTPPTWDPLGAAPFAWDLPDPAPEPAPVQTPQARLDRPGVLHRVTMGVALFTGGLLAAGVFAGWWSLSWAGVAAITLAVVGLGLLIASLIGRRGRSLIGPGIFLSLLTLALTVTGIAGAGSYGQHVWTPSTAAAVDGHVFEWNAGQATLDLSGLKVKAGEAVTTSLRVNAGRATVIVPDGVDVEATCTARIGAVRCLGEHGSGIQPAATGTSGPATAAPPDGDVSGRLTITVHSNTGEAEVRTHG